MEIREPQIILGKAIFFFIIGAGLATLFMWGVIQGIKAHWAGDELALIYYFAAWLAGVATLAFYTQAKHLFHYAKISR
ncbi:MAG: hypothetical protein JW772_04365 [Candidatus Diapherotrites archaeon]|nr:hypothetical protein [Candidatus Diapherotrites archaeon]